MLESTTFQSRQPHPQAVLTDTVTAGQTTAAVALWSDYVNADPIQDVFAASEEVWKRTGKYPTTMAISRSTFRHLRRCERIKSEITASGAGEQAIQSAITLQKLAEVFDLQEVVYSDSIKNTANPSKPAVIASQFPDNQAVLTVSSSSVDLSEPSFGRTLNYDGDGSQILGDRMIGVVEQYGDPSRRGDKLRVRHQTGQLVLFPEMAQVITGVR